MAKKRKIKYMRIPNIINQEVALTQAATALDGAYFAAEKNEDAEQMAIVGALWLDIANRLSPAPRQKTDEVQGVILESRQYKVGFEGPLEEEFYDE